MEQTTSPSLPAGDLRHPQPIECRPAPSVVSQETSQGDGALVQTAGSTAAEEEPRTRSFTILAALACFVSPPAGQNPAARRVRRPYRRCCGPRHRRSDCRRCRRGRDRLLQPEHDEESSRRPPARDGPSRPEPRTALAGQRDRRDAVRIAEACPALATPAPCWCGFTSPPASAAWRREP